MASDKQNYISACLLPNPRNMAGPNECECRVWKALASGLSYVVSTEVMLGALRRKASHWAAVFIIRGLSSDLWRGM